MFGGGNPTEYEDIVNKTTDENLTSENWELILNLCDKVQDEGQPGAHSAIAAVLKRLAHRNPNVQLYALSLTESLGKNLGIEIHRELASRAFTQGLEKLITDRNTHEKVRRRALALIALWTAEFEKDTTLGIMEECYNALKAKNYKFQGPEEPPPPSIDDEARRREEEELQRALEMSMQPQNRGGRSQWAQYSLTGAAASSSSSAAPGPAAASSSSSTGTGGASAPGTSSSPAHPFAQPKYQAGGYVPARTPSPATVAAQQRAQQAQYHQAVQQQQQQQRQAVPPRSASLGDSSPGPGPAQSSTPTPRPSTSSSSSATQHMNMNTNLGTSSTPSLSSSNIITRVRALHTFEPTEPGELAFEKGDVIKVVDRGYKDWWRGQLKGRTGIFPVNYVEPMPEPTAPELAKEAEQEAAVFAQAVNVEKLLNMLRALDPAKDNLADDEEIQELYRSSMALRPKIVKLIDKYSQKRADLVSMNETFVRARTIFDRMMEESLARHSGVYDQPTYRPPYAQHAHTHSLGGHPGRPDSRGGRRGEYAQGPPQQQPQPQPYMWNNNGPGPGPVGYDPQQPSPGYGAPQPQPQNAYGIGMVSGPTPGPGIGPGPGIPGPGQGYDPNAAAAAAYALQQQQQQPGYPGGYGGQQQQPGAPYSQQGPTPYPVAIQPHQLQLQQPIHGIPQQQQQQQPLQQPVQAVQHPVQQQQQVQPQPQPVQQQQQQQQPALAQVQTQVQPEPTQIVQQVVSPVGASTSPLPLIAAQAPVQPQPQQPQPQVQPQVQAQPQPQPQAQPQPQPQPQPQAQAQPHPQQPISGPPPYAYDPTYTYADPNVQAWAQYYAQGGTDLAGSVYFVAIPGVTAAAATPGPGPEAGSVGVGVNAGAAGEAVQQGQGGGQGVEGHAQQQQRQPQRQQSQPYDIQVQHPETHAGAANNNGVRTASPIQQQQQRPTSFYQLQDPGQYQSEVGPKSASPTSPGSGFGFGPGSASIGSGRLGRSGSYQGPAQVAGTGTPAWVLPKKATPGPGAGAGVGVGGQQGQASGESYFPQHQHQQPGGQLGGVSLSDPGSANGNGLL